MSHEEQRKAIMPVAYGLLDIDGDYLDIHMSEESANKMVSNMAKNHGYSLTVVPLYTSPQQSNALEMAAKVCESLSSEYQRAIKDANPRTSKAIQNRREGGLDGCLKCAKEIRALIPQPQQAIPSGWKLVPIDPTEDMEAYGNSKADEIAVRVNGTRFKLDMCTAYEVYKAMLNVAPQPESDGK